MQKRYIGYREAITQSRRRFVSFLSILTSLSVAIFFLSGPRLSLQAEKRSQTDLKVGRVVGKGYEIETGKFVFWEKHRQIWKGEKLLRSVVAFHNPKGELFARKYLDFQKNQDAPNFILKDYRDGYYESIKWIDKNQFLFELRRKEGNKLKKNSIVTDPPVVIDGGFDNYIRDNFTDLIQRSHTVSFALPYRRDFVSLDLKNRGERIFQSKKVVAIQLIISNVLIRQLASPINLLYDKKKQHLLMYEGISSINNKKGKSFQTRIIYKHYPLVRQ